MPQGLGEPAEVLRVILLLRTIRMALSGKGASRLFSRHGRIALTVLCHGSLAAAFEVYTDASPLEPADFKAARLYIPAPFGRILSLKGGAP